MQGCGKDFDASLKVFSVWSFGHTDHTGMAFDPCESTCVIQEGAAIIDNYVIIEPQIISHLRNRTVRTQITFETFLPFMGFLMHLQCVSEEKNNKNYKKVIQDGSTELTYLENSSHTFYSAWVSHWCEASGHAPSGLSSCPMLRDTAHIGIQAYHLLRNQMYQT
jgi:hypothetical protein